MVRLLDSMDEKDEVKNQMHKLLQHLYRRNIEKTHIFLQHLIENDELINMTKHSFSFAVKKTKREIFFYDLQTITIWKSHL